jgi:hypothetical protein
VDSKRRWLLLRYGLAPPLVWLLGEICVFRNSRFVVFQFCDCFAMPFTYKPLQVKVQFDFEGEEENGELTIREGDIITVICQVSCPLILFMSSSFKLKWPWDCVLSPYCG